MAIKSDSRNAVRALNALAARRGALAESVEEFGDVELGESAKLVPVKTGELKESRYRGKAKFAGNKITVLLGYTAPHAQTVHEDMEAFHRVGQAKYLEQPLNESAPYFPSRVAVSFYKKLGIR
jgi:hypothetical protein